MKRLLSLWLILFSTIVFALTPNTGYFDKLTTNNPASDTVIVLKNIDVQATGGMYLPSGTTLERPTPTKDGLFRYNSTTQEAEMYYNGAWGSVGGGGISLWITATDYALNDIVISSDKIYRCTTGHTSGATFLGDIANWTEVSEATGNYVDLSTNQTVAGDKTLTGSTIIGNAGTESTGINVDGTNYQSTFKVSDINGSNYAQTILHRHSTILEPLILGARSNTDTTSHADVTAGQNLFSIYGSGSAGTNYKLFGGVNIAASSLGSISDTSAPGKIVLSTTPNAATGPTATLTLDSDKSATFAGTASATQYTSTIATGTAPLVVASTTKVDNLHVARATLADTVTTNANLTGDVTSVGNATTYAAVVPTTKGGTGLSTVGTETKVLKVVSGVPAYAEEDRSNYLLNPNFEWSTLSDWTCTVGTCTSTSTSGEFSEGLLALKVALSASVMNVSQSVATVAGATKQYVIGVSYRVPSTMEDFQICTLIAGSEKTCVPSANLILDDAYHTIEIPEVITPGSTVGIKFKTTSAYTANAYFDKAYIKQGIGTQALQLDYLYSAKVSSAGAITDETSDFISSCSASAGKTTCQFTTGRFTVIPNCWAITKTTSGGTISETIYMDTANYSTTEVAFKQVESGSASSDAANLFCMKTGADYLAASAAVYSQSSANFSGINGGAITIGATTTAPTKGTTTIDRVMYSRYGNRLNADYQYNQTVAGSDGSGDYLFTLPAGLSFDSNEVTFDATASATWIAGTKIDPRAFVGRSTSSLNGDINIDMVMIAYSATQFRVLMTNSTVLSSSTFYDVGVLGTSEIAGMRLSGTPSYNFKIDAPILGWSNSSSIVGTFAGTPKVPGLDGNVDSFTINYGTTNGTTDCSASPCSYLDQFGTGGVASITRAGAGSYVINTLKTYSKFKCTADLWRSSSNTIGTVGNTKINCTSTAACAFTTEGVDTHGNLNCIGSY